MKLIAAAPGLLAGLAIAAAGSNLTIVTELTSWSLMLIALGAALAASRRLRAPAAAGRRR